MDIATVNPYRYRSYYYDSEIGLYYVSSRYYDPEIGRFLNSDDPMFLGANGNIASYNLFAYCENNPINMVDLTGNIAANVIGAIIGGVIGAVGGAFLGKWLADRLGITGFWAHAAFIGAVGLLVIQVSLCTICVLKNLLEALKMLNKFSNILRNKDLPWQVKMVAI